MTRNTVYGECPTCGQPTSAVTGMLVGDNQPFAVGNTIAFSDGILKNKESVILRLPSLCHANVEGKPCNGVLIIKITDLENKGFVTEKPEYHEHEVGTIFAIQ